jgi:hypothetical protein
MSRRRIWILAAALTLVAAHLLFAYSPRERATVASAPFARLLDGEGGWNRVVWIAYPHQNLGAIDEALGDLDAYLAQLSRVAEVEAPRVPHFGPFAVPPSRELVLAWNDRRDRDVALVGIARVYRGLGWIARAAGAIAGNPWLAGGEAESGGRSYRVRWEGPLWIVESGAVTLATRTNAPETAGGAPALAQARLGVATGPVAPGRYRLAREADGIEVRGGSLPARALDPLEEQRAIGALRLDLPELALWVARADRGEEGGPGLFLLWEDADSVLPRAAVLQRGAGRIFRLPGEELLEMVGKAEPRRRLGWIARGTDRKARGAALRIVPWLERNYPRPEAGSAWLSAAGRLAPRRAVGMLNRLAERLRAIPLVPPAEIERMEAGALLLKPLSDCPRVTFEVWRDPDGVRVRLCPRGPSDDIPSVELESSPEEDGEIDGSDGIG